MPHVPGLRSPYVKVGRLVYFGRMLDKIRLHAEGRLPAEYVANLGDTHPTFFDGRCCRFLGVSYTALVERVINTRHTDFALLEWAHEEGRARTDEECMIWNMFLMKRGWRDEATGGLPQRAQTLGVADKPIQTVFDLIDFDEERDPIGARAWTYPPPRIVVVMGVAGSGKSRIGGELAAALGWAFYDADDLHPPENIAKMSAGIPLNDDDRWPWLGAVRAQIDRSHAAGECAVIACSALRHRYREVLLKDLVRERLVYLRGTPELLGERLSARSSHFMKPAMLQSQLQTLQEPYFATTVEVQARPEEIVRQIRQELGL